jgi:hypothetical protein
VGYFADRTQQRGLFNMGMSSIGVLGFLLLAVSTSPKLSYFAVFLGAGGIYPCISNTITWVGNNCDGVYRRGVTLGAVIAWGNLNGGTNRHLPSTNLVAVVSSNIYRANQKPWYRTGHWVVFGYLLVFLFTGSAVNYFCLKVANRTRGGSKGRLFTL